MFKESWVRIVETLPFWLRFSVVVVKHPMKMLAGEAYTKHPIHKTYGYNTTPPPFSFRIILHLHSGEHSNLLCVFGWLWLCWLSDEIDLKCAL
jgi:hypothetical protein